MSLFTTAAGTWQLQRFPARSQDTLQAWEAADELLHEIIVSRNDERPLLVNDQWGALLMPFAGLDTASLSDSYVSHLGWRHNLTLNQLPKTLSALSPLDQIPDDRDVVYIKIPKSLSLLELQLAKIAAELPAGVPVFAAAKSRLLTPAVRELFAKYCDAVDVSLIRRKCRTIRAVVRNTSFDTERFMSVWQASELNLTLHHHAGVFARNQLDIGARFMLDHMPPAGAEHVVDLGCGNGVLGLHYARLSPESHITFVDESYLAVASTHRNVIENLPTERITQYHTQVDDCLAQTATDSIDLIICNPPFHQEHAVTEHIARQMFRDSRRVLRKNGELWVVANRHLPYYQSLKRLFKSVHQVAQNSKFVILQARG